jgi:hypothetical protein
MAVYKRSYRGYAGPVTSEWSRFAIIPRYAYRGLFRSKIMTAFFVICFIPPLVFLFLIYLANNIGSFAKVFGVTGATSPFAVDGEFFASYLGIQAGLSFVLTAFVGPGLISGRSRAALSSSSTFSRTFLAGGVRGRQDVGTAHTALAHHLGSGADSVRHPGRDGGMGMAGPNLWLGWALFAGSWIWILVLSLMALALSAWVKWRIAAALCCWRYFSWPPVWRGDQCRARCALGQTHQSDVSVRDGLEPAISVARDV